MNSYSQIASKSVEVNIRPTITVLTPNYNTEIEIIDFLESITRQDYPIECIEIIVIDNNSTDKSVKNVQEWFKKHNQFYNTKLIELKKNFGIAKAYNVGYDNKSTESRIIIRTESDIELENNCISNLVDALMSDDSYGIIGARGVFFYDKKTLNHAARYLNWWNGDVKEFDPPTIVECDFVFGGTFAVKTEVIKSMDYFFNENRFLANELEFCTRVNRKGYKVMCQPNAIAYHKGGQTTNKLISNKFYFINIRETTFFHLEFNSSLKRFTTISFLFLSSVKQFFFSNRYALMGIISSILSYAFKRDIFVPWKKKKMLISEWLIK